MSKKTYIGPDVSAYSNRCGGIGARAATMGTSALSRVPPLAANFDGRGVQASDGRHSMPFDTVLEFLTLHDVLLDENAISGMEEGRASEATSFPSCRPIIHVHRRRRSLHQHHCRSSLYGAS